MVDPKYYGGSDEGLRAAFSAFTQHGCRLLVGGRLEQGSVAGRERRFLTLSDLVMPACLADFAAQGLFISIDERDFREDISSTELRARASSPT